MNITPVFEYVTDNPISSAVIAGVAVLVLGLTYLVGRKLLGGIVRVARRWIAPRPAEDILTIVAASIATGVSAQGMWRFSGDVLGFDGLLQVGLFAFVEVAMVTSAVRARRNMRENHKAGVDGLAVWALTGLSAALSAMDARSFAEAIFRMAAPLVAAWLWERGMSIERQRLTGRTRINWRLTPERVLVRVGLAESSTRTASEVDAHRRLTRVALAAKRARALREAGASDRKQRGALTKLDKAMDRAVEHTGLVQDLAMQQRMLAQIGALYNTSALTELQPRSFWQQLVDDAAARAERDRAGAAAVAVLENFANGRSPVFAPLPAIGSADVNGAGRGDTTPPVSPSDTTSDTTGDTTSGGDKRGRQPRPPRRTVAATRRRHDSTTARTRQGDTGGDNAQRVAKVARLLTRQPTPQQGDIARQLGVSMRTVQRDIERAKKEGLLSPGDTTRQAADDTTGGAAPDTT
ncbi:HTH domain-containing protein [Streptosporangium sp. NPDC049248]|uniref:HTH domain-containing protein n=1 Tax=Streptosporangium sp. NPDC049248 TaxID=3155651 RepID=UPI003425268B